MHRLHRAWLVAAAGFVALLAAAAIRATFGILMEPLMAEFGWSHGAIATAASINLLVFGLSAPFAAAFTERFGLRKVVVAALSAIALSALALTQATQLWQLYVIWGSSPAWRPARSRPCSRRRSPGAGSSRGAVSSSGS